MGAENMGLRDDAKDGTVKEADARKLSEKLRIKSRALDEAARWLDEIRDKRESIVHAAQLLRVQARTLRDVAQDIDSDICGDIPF